MGFVQSVRSVFAQYATFSGRASRSEYWWFVLFQAVLNLALDLIEPLPTDRGGLFSQGFGGSEDEPFSLATFGGAQTPLHLIIGLALILPSLAVLVRRLHDANHSAWSLLLFLIPLLGIVLYFVYTLQRSDPLGAQFDAPNHYREAVRPGD